MSKGTSRTVDMPLRRKSPASPSQGGGGGVAAVPEAGCRARAVVVATTHTLTQLRAMGDGDLSVRGTQIVIRRGHAQVATVQSDVDELRRCIERERVPFEADLRGARERNGHIEVRVRPRPRR